MHTDQICAKLAKVFEDVFGEPIGLTEATTADDVEGWDSVRNVELMVAIEEAFGLRLTTAGLTAFANIGELVAHLRERLPSEPTGARQRPVK